MSNNSPDESSLYLSINSISSLAISADDLFKNRDFPQQFLYSLHKALESGHLIDTIIVSGVDNKRIPAHKIVLSVCSPFFNAMFNSDMKEKNEKEIRIEEVDGETLELLVNYCYLGTININEDNVERVLSTACRFQMSNVVAVCSKFLGKQLHFSNAIGFKVFAEQQNCSELHKISLKFVESNFMDIYEKSEEFMQLNVDQLAKLLANNDINVISEEDVFKAVVKWINFSEDRKQYISTLFPLIKLPQLSPVFLADEVEKYCTELDTQKMLLNAYKYLLIPERRDLSSNHAIPRKSTVGKLLCLGGMDHNKGTTNIESFDLRENNWELLKSMPTRRLQFGCALYMDKLIIVGGRDGLKTLNSVDAVDLQTMNFTSLSSPMSTSRHGLAVALLKNALYAIGGHDGWSYLNTVERLDLISKSWSFIAPMNTMRSTCGVAILDEKLYIIGGRESSICHRTVEMYDPNLNKFVFKAPMNRRRGGVASIAHNNYIYVFGGYDLPVSNPQCQRTSSVERYDSASDSWTLIANLDVGRDSIGVGVLGNYIITVGGFNGTEYSKSVEKYDPEKNEIEPLKSLNFARAGSCIVTIRNDQLSGCSNESFFSIQQHSVPTV